MRARKISKKIAFFFAAAFLATRFAAVPCLSQTATQAEKPGLSEKDLEKYTFYFDISDNKFAGDGARLLADEINASQFVLLGEYHNSRRISEFTQAVIPIFDEAGCRIFGLEIGPVSAQILSKLSNDPARTIFNLKTFNSKFYVADKSRIFTPIPFFSSVEDAEFLVEAQKRKWNLLGLDQEFSFGYLPLVERMYENLGSRKKQELKQLYERVKSSISGFYEADIKDGKSQYRAISESKEIDEFLEKAAEDSPQNKRIAAALKFTTGIYLMNDAQIRKYYEANGERVSYMKRNLAEGFAKYKFDLKKDKMLLKMGAAHTGRGFSDLSLFEIGNTLSELAAFHGNRSLHIEFGSRYYFADGQETDALADANGFLYRYRALLQVARKDRWTVIDLRPLRKYVFYGRRFNLDPIVLEIFKNQDLYVIAPVEKAPTPNYVLRK